MCVLMEKKSKLQKAWQMIILWDVHLNILYLSMSSKHKENQQKSVLKYAPKKYNFWTISCAIKRKPLNLFWWGGTINIAEGFFGVCISNDTTLCNENCKRKSLNLIWWIMCLQMMKATESNWSQWRMESKRAVSHRRHSKLDNQQKVILKCTSKKNFRQLVLQLRERL